jgi:FKBP-type peptidyl-prolyl cis-trans isomerase.
MLEKNKISKIIIAISALFIIASCGKEKDESLDSIQKRVLEAYLEINYPNAKPSESGLVVLSKTPGDGKVLEEYDFAYLRYSTKMLDGVYQTYNFEDVAKRLGTYSKSTYYGPKLYYIGYGNTIIGLEELLLGEKKGAKLSAIIPPWLSKYKSNGSNTSQENQNNLIYDVELEEVIEDIEKFQIDTLEAYSKKYYGGIDSTAYGYYFKKIVSSGKDSVSAGTSVNVTYVGKLLDGFIFDTNIADSAKKYEIYNASKTYSPLSISYSATADEMAENNEIKIGFAKAVKSMTIGDEAIVFFDSNYGYGATSSGSIGPYQPLFFYIKVEEEE